jgi:nucleoside-diphosphate-sugar epimerase
MKITVIGGTGLIGTRLVRRLQATGHDVLAASRSTGVNSYTGEGLEDALAGADVLVDVSNSSYTDEAGARDFFYTSTMNLLSYGEAAGVGHHVALSVVGIVWHARRAGTSSPKMSRSGSSESRGARTRSFTRRSSSNSSAASRITRRAATSSALLMC